MGWDEGRRGSRPLPRCLPLTPDPWGLPVGAAHPVWCRRAQRTQRHRRPYFRLQHLHARQVSDCCAGGSGCPGPAARVCLSVTAMLESSCSQWCCLYVPTFLCAQAEVFMVSMAGVCAASCAPWPSTGGAGVEPPREGGSWAWGSNKRGCVGCRCSRPRDWSFSSEGNMHAVSGGHLYPLHRLMGEAFLVPKGRPLPCQSPSLKLPRCGWGMCKHLGFTAP